MTTPYKSIVGKRFGLGPSGPLFEGRPVGGFLPRGPKGKVYFVDSAIDATEGTSPETAVGTLDEAFALTTANQGDVIYVMPNHAETVTGVAGIAHDVAGVSVVGLGYGNQRPRFLMDAATTVTYAITAADAYVENCVFASGHSGVVTCFTTTKAGSTFVNVEFENNTTNENFLTCIKATSTTDNDSDNLSVIGCRWITSDADDLEFIEINANLKGLVVRDNFVVNAGTASPLILCAGTKELHGALIAWNFLQNANTANDIAFDNGGTANTGIIAHNRIGHSDVTGAHVLGAVAGCRFFDNLSVSTDALSGFVLPAIDVDL